MAGAIWEHACPVTGRTKQRDERWTCLRCRERARLAGVSYSMIEQMGRYSRCYGVGSVGRHRPLADKLLQEIAVTKCERCGGTGDCIVGDEDVRNCWSCAGTGVAPESWDAIARVRAQVIEAYPESARSYPPERSSVVWQPRSEPAAMPSTGVAWHVVVMAVIFAPVGLAGGISVVREGRVLDGLFMLYFGGLMTFFGLWGADVVTLRLRTARVVLLVLAAVFVVLFLLVMVHGVANMPD